MPNYYLQPNWNAPQHVHALTTLRTFPGNETTLQTHLSALELPQHAPFLLKQIHGIRALESLPENHQAEADACFTTQKNRLCIVQTADCLPLLLTDTAGTTIAAIHAGWRGLANGIIENTIASMPKPASPWLAWLGPAIGSQQFVVREDVYQIFTQADIEAKQAFHQINPEQWLVDIYHLARLRLQRLGIEQIYGGEYCTFSDPDRFFSYRRDAGAKNRLYTLIWMS